MTEGADQQHDLAWYAAALDESALAGSRYSMAVRLRQKLGYQITDDLDETTPGNAKAAVWAIDYHLEISEEGRRLVQLLPRHDLGGTPQPPKVADVSDTVKATWRALLAQVHSPVVKARLGHLLFESFGRERATHGGIAVDAYIESASVWTRGLDAVDDLSVATRLARAIGDEARAILSLEKMLDFVQKLLEEESPLAGPVLRGLQHAVNEPLTPAARLDELLEKAATRLRDADLRDKALVWIQERCSDETCRQRLWKRRVNAYIELAKSSDSGLLRLANLQDALNLAERSNNPELCEQAAAELQKVREQDLELIRFESSSAMYEELFDRVRDSFSAGHSWQEALFSFANAGPLSGDIATNKALVAELRAAAPLTALMPVKLVGPDGLPILEAVTDEEKFEYDLVRIETQHIQGNTRPFVAALHSIVEKFGLPTTGDLAQFLSSWPGMDRQALRAIVRALYRFWTGDSEAAIYTLVPRIEGLVRNLILSQTNRGLFKLQQSHKPGQFPGLGAMLVILSEEFDISESMFRFLKVVLVEPAGFNVRNRLSHGIDDFGDPGTAATLLHTALFLATLRPKSDEETEQPGDAAG